MTEIVTFADLFCGIGGFHYAAEAHGMDCVFACDSDPHARRQYESNFGIEPRGDIREIASDDIPEHDLLFAGFPCQPFSVIGKSGGMDDDRGSLIGEIVRILRDRKPKAFVLENVPRLATMNGGRALDCIRGMIADAGYLVECRILDARDYGLPQSRRRLIMVGFRDHAVMQHFEDTWDSFLWAPDPPRQMAPLSSILERNPDPRHFASDEIQRKRKAAHTPAETPSIWHENKSGNISSHPYSCALRANASYNYLLVDGERRLTPDEQLALQGFPWHFKVVGSDAQIRKQAGNAVPVPMVQDVIGRVITAFRTHAAAVRKAKANGWRTADDVDDLHDYVIEKGEIVRVARGKVKRVGRLKKNGKRKKVWVKEGDELLRAKKDMRFRIFFQPGEREEPDGYYCVRYPLWGHSMRGMDESRAMSVSLIGEFASMLLEDALEGRCVPGFDRDRLNREILDSFEPAGFEKVE